MRERSLLVSVVVLAAVLTVPPMLLAVVATTRWVESERGRLQTFTRANVDRALAQVDRYLGGKIAMLQALATSPAIDLGDFQRLDAQARELLDLQGLNIVMRDLNGLQLVNTRVPWATPLPRVPNYQADHEVAATRAPLITGLYPGVMAGGPLIRVIVPVMRNGEVWYTLTASLSPPVMTGLLREAGLGDPYFGSVADRDGLILARATHDPALIGKKLPGFDESPGAAGTWSGVNPQGITVYAHWRRSPLSGWFFSVGIDRHLLDGPLYRSLWWLGSLAVALGIVAFTASSVIVGRIVGSHRQIEAAAVALGRGEAVAPIPTRLRETNLIGEALSKASARIREQADALVLANRDLERRVEERTLEVRGQADLIKATLDNMDQGLMLVDADGHVPICNERAMALLDLPAELMAGRPTFEAVLRHQLAGDEFAKSGDLMRDWVAGGGMERTLHTYERERPNGVVLEIRTVPLASGAAVRTYTDVTARKAAERLSYDMARHDGLTGLPNRTFLRERLTTQLADPLHRNAPFAVLCFDLDRFKLVNDTLGHPAGDALLQVVAARIASLVSRTDILARIGGDEFAIIQVGGAQPHAAAALAQRVVESIRHPIDLEGRPIHVGASIGIAVAPGDGRDADQIFKNADLALYAAKNAGRGTFRFYQAEMDLAAQARRRLETDLRQALARDEFELHYQPLVRISDGSISGFEALLRWNHPTRGRISPVEFIPVAEDARLIVPLGSWVLREACREAASWPTDTRVLVNISALQVEDPGLSASVLAAIAGSGLPPSRLQLEITETVLMHESPAVLEALNALREFGIRIALDDFGTGYASLSYLVQVPLDGIKIDRSYVQDEDDPIRQAIFDAIVGLGTRLGISVTAEGVETAEQLERVRRSGCAEVQGFYFSRPVPAAEARRLLAAPLVSAAA